NIDNIIYLAKKMNCDAIHPGFGFLSENVNFAKACLDNDIVFVGPTPNQIELMGNKSKARETMISLNVPVVPGSKSILKDKEEAKLLASSIGYPVMIKASSGGGGKGMRIIFKESEFDSLFDIAKSEALASFGDSSLYMEKYIENPRHIEVQVFGDSFNNAIHLGDRDCSMQRRNQKVIEESLSHYLDEAQRKKLYETSIAVIKGIGYLGAGTIEFIVDKDKNFYFIEMNTRIQVEHPVTEMITGIDLIKLQLLIASGEKIPFKQEDVKFRGHAIECRINAEDAENDFKPSPGKVESLHIPGGFGVRFDTFIYPGYTIPPIYDSMLGKLICIADTRDECISRMDRALDEIIIEGITSNIEFQRSLINSDEFKNNTHHTKFIETSFIKSLNA
ncbi:ATP-grasp domain-containing protein, partial [Paeniclostridium sordellii]